MDPPKLLFGIVLRRGIRQRRGRGGEERRTKIVNEKGREDEGEESRDIQVLDCLEVAQVLRKLSRDSVVVQDTIV